METGIDDVIYNVQNPAIGATILWRFICGFYQTNSNEVPFPLLFVVMPMIFREDLCEVINSTQKAKGLSKVSEKLFSKRSNDKLFSVNDVSIKMRPLTLQAFNIGVATNLFSMDYNTAHVFPLTQTKRTNLSKETNKLLNAAEKLGLWCSELSLVEICNMLKVRF